MYNIKTKTYLFKEEFCKELKISNYIFDRRKDDLLEWLKNFYEYDLLEGKPMYIIIKEILGEYKPLPRKSYGSEERENFIKQKKKDYEEFTIKSLGNEFKPNSKSKIAREAINEFGYEKYGHYSKEGVVRRYIKEPFDTYGETNNKTVWVKYPSYEIISDDLVREWKNILSEFKITREKFSSLYDEYFLAKVEGGNVLKDIDNYYEQALNKFKELYGFIPVFVKEWKLKDLKRNSK